MAKYQLDVDYDYDFQIVAICCHSKDYRISWYLNKNLELALEKSLENIEIQLKGNFSIHTVYKYHNANTQANYKLITNRGSNGFLVQEHKNVDYFLIIENNYTEELKQIIDKIKSLSIVLTAFDLDIKELKSRQNLIFN
jgi:hypothetical protein